jgi:hypothetical protein
MQQMSQGGSRYILVLTDDFSRKSWLYFLKSKDEMLYKFCIFKARLELETGNKIRILRSDKGGEYLSNEFKSYCSENGIIRELIQAAMPQQNGMSERRNQTLMERAHNLASDCNLPISLWTEAAATAAYLINRNPTRANSGTTPEEKFSGKKPNIDHLNIFGCISYLHVPKDSRKKLDSKTQKCLFLRYDEESKVYRLYDHKRQKIVLSRDVIFDETKVGYSFLSNSINPPDSIFSFSNNQLDSETNPEISSSSQNLDHPNLEITEPITSDDPKWTQLDIEPLSHNNPAVSLTEASSNSTLTTHSSPTSENNPGHRKSKPADGNIVPSNRRYPIRQRAPSSRLKDFWTLVSEILDEPLDFYEASQKQEWKDAMQTEIDSILKNQTWAIVDRPPRKKPITAKWIFKTKRDPSGKISKLKAIIVARGFQQQEGIDYNDVFAPVVRWSTIRAILALAAKYRWDLHQLDVITAFLNGDIHEEIFMEIPEGFLGSLDPSKVCKVNRALYGLKQAPKAWYERINSWLIRQGLTHSQHDPNLYFSVQNGKRTILLLYVDDLLLTGDNVNEIERLKSELQKEFEMTNLGLAHNYLGTEIVTGLNDLFIHQRGYIKKNLKKFDLEGCNPTKLPMDPNLKLQKNTGTPKVDPLEYMSIVGSLIYLTNIRPDICFAVSCVS